MACSKKDRPQIGQKRVIPTQEKDDALLLYLLDKPVKGRLNLPALQHRRLAASSSEDHVILVYNDL